MAPTLSQLGMVIASLSSVCSLCSAAKTQFYDTYYGDGKIPNTPVTLAINGFEDPAKSTKSPVHFHMPGHSEPFFVPVRVKIYDYMFTKGFVSASMGYYNHHMCMSICYDNENQNCSVAAQPRVSLKKRAISIKSGVSKLCGRATTDCTLGVAVSGYSYGSVMSQFMAWVDPRVTATLAISLGKYSATYLGGFLRFSQERQNKMTYDCIENTKLSAFLPQTKRRFLNGATDFMFTNGTVMFGMKDFSGYDCGASTDCIKADGSGFYITQTADFSAADKALWAFTYPMTANGHYPHTAFPINSTAIYVPTYETGSAKWSMPVIFTWLAGAASVPAPAPSSSPSPSPVVSGAAGKHGIVGMFVMLITMSWMA